MTRSALPRALTFLIAVSPASIAGAQGITSTSQLRSACEQAPQNTITLFADTKISAGASAFFPEQVASGCTILLAPGVKLEFEGVGMVFAGPPRIASTSATELTRVTMATVPGVRSASAALRRPPHGR